MLVWVSQAAWAALPVFIQVTASTKPRSTFQQEKGHSMSNRRWGVVCAEDLWALGGIGYFQESFYFLQKLLIAWKAVGKKKKEFFTIFFLRNCAGDQGSWICLSYPTPSSIYKKLFCGKSWIQSWICSDTDSLLDIGPDNFSPYVSISLQMRDNDGCPWGQGRALMHPSSTGSCCKDHGWAPARHSCSCGSALGVWLRECCFSCQYLHLSA